MYILKFKDLIGRLGNKSILVKLYFLYFTLDEFPLLFTALLGNSLYLKSKT